MPARYNKIVHISGKTIAKILGFVIFLTAAPGGLTGCSPSSSSRQTSFVDRLYAPSKIVGRFENRQIKESSGIAASRCQPNIFWTHNDSGDGPFIFALDKTGKNLGKWRVAAAENIDWEDIDAAKNPDGSCVLYIGEIGNNKLDRSEMGIYRVPEPVVGPTPPAENTVGETAPASLLRFSYPDGSFNAETLMVDPRSGVLYVLTKMIDAPAGIYRLQPDFGAPRPAVAEKTGEIAVPSVPNGLLTGGSISPDGRRVIICDYTSGYELVLPADAASFDDVWKQKPSTVDLGDRKQGEAVTYSADGRSIIAASEGKNAAIFEISRLDR